MDVQIIDYNGAKYEITSNNGVITIVKNDGKKIEPDMLEYAEVLKIASEKTKKDNQDLIDKCVEILVEQIHDGNLVNVEDIENYIKNNFSSLKDEQKAEVYDKAKEVITKELSNDKIVNEDIYNVIKNNLEEVKQSPEKQFLCDFKISGSVFSMDAFTRNGNVENKISFPEGTTWDFTEEMKNFFLNQVAVVFAENDHHINNMERMGYDDYRLSIRTEHGAILKISGMSEAYAKDLYKIIEEKTRVQGGFDEKLQNDYVNEYQNDELRDPVTGLVIQEGGLVNEEERLRELNGPVRVRKIPNDNNHGNTLLPYIMMFVVGCSIVIGLISYLLFK